MLQVTEAGMVVSAGISNKELAFILRPDRHCKVSGQRAYLS
jgi:hypothetical protein